MDLRINDLNLKIFYYVILILKYFCFKEYFNLNRTKYSMLQEFYVNLNLTEIFSLKKSPAYSPDFSRILYIREYKYI